MADKELDSVVGEIRERLKKISELYSDVLERFPPTPNQQLPANPIMEKVGQNDNHPHSRYR